MQLSPTPFIAFVASYSHIVHQFTVKPPQVEFYNS